MKTKFIYDAHGNSQTTEVDVKTMTSFHASQCKYKITREQKAVVPIAFTIKHVMRTVHIYARPIKHRLNSTFNYIPAVIQTELHMARFIWMR